MRRLRICYVGTPWLAVGPRRGGIPKTILELSRALARDHDVHVVSPRPSPGTPHLNEHHVRVHYAPVSEVLSYPIPEKLEPGLTGFRLLVRMAFAVVAIFAAYEALRRTRRIEVTVITNKYVALPILLFLRRQRAVFVYSERNIWPWLYPAPSDGWSRLRHVLNVWLGKVVCRLSDGVHANSESLRNALMAHGLDVKRIVVIPNGVDLGSQQDGPRPLSDPVTIAFVGRLVEDKGVRTLLEVIQRLNVSNRQLHFAIFGDGPLRHLFSEKTIENCTWYRERPREEVIAQLRFAHIALFLSPVENVPSNALMEALALGKAVIATNVGDTPRFLINGQSGILCDPDPASVTKAITDLLDNKEQYSRLTSGAKLFASAYSWDEIARRHAEFYASVMSAAEA